MSRNYRVENGEYYSYLVEELVELADSTLQKWKRITMDKDGQMCVYETASISPNKIFGVWLASDEDADYEFIPIKNVGNSGKGLDWETFSIFRLDDEQKTDEDEDEDEDTINWIKTIRSIAKGVRKRNLSSEKVRSALIAMTKDDNVRFLLTDAT